jgi:hypothetical protein
VSGRRSFPFTYSLFENTAARFPLDPSATAADANLTGNRHSLITTPGRRLAILSQAFYENMLLLRGIYRISLAIRWVFKYSSAAHACDSQCKLDLQFGPTIAHFKILLLLCIRRNMKLVFHKTVK